MFWLLVSCFQADPELQSRVAVLEAQHQLDQARLFALEEKWRKMEENLALAPAISGGAASGAGGDPPETMSKPALAENDGQTSGSPATAPVSVATTARCGRAGDLWVWPAIEPSTEDLARSARVIPHFASSDELDGLKLVGIRSDSLASSCGFHNGDVVNTVAGVGLYSVEDAMTAYEAARRKSTFTVELTRRGEFLKQEYRRGSGRSN